MLRNLVIGTLLSAGAISVAHADYFRWVDDHGGVHYSDQWVPGSEVIKTSQKAPSGGSSGHSTYTAPKRSAAPPPSQDNAAKAVKDDVAKARDQQCKDAKDRYDKAIQARRIYKAAAPSNKPAQDTQDKPEERQFLSEEEADAYRVKARQDYMDACGSQTSK
ncbi:MAG: DUF4124 domain-containing protein [Proteobacteria bacterium]|nr:DUF4124 domain-containing protein [Pseudomonadota bacterium]